MNKERAIMKAAESLTNDLLVAVAVSMKENAGDPQRCVIVAAAFVEALLTLGDTAPEIPRTVINLIDTVESGVS